ncbi:Exocyst complex component S3A [Dionaea muscipula]
MAKSSADDQELRRTCEAAIDGTKEKIIMAIRVAKSHGLWGKSSKFGRHMAKPRVLAITAEEKGQRSKAFLRVLKYSTGGVLEAAKLYKLRHLSKVEVITNDTSGCTFTMGFDNLRSQSVALPQWTMRNVDDRNRLLLSILNVCKDMLGHLPKVIGIDVVEMALWAKENKTVVVTDHMNFRDGPVTVAAEKDLKVTVEKELVTQAEEEDMEALLGTYVMDIGEAEAFSERLKRELLALEAANVHAILETEPLVEEVSKGLDSAISSVEDLNEWLGIFNVKLRHMREDIESIETRNNKLAMQSVNNGALIDELDKLLARLRVPSECATCLTTGSFDEANMIKNIEACEWLRTAIRGLQVPNLDPAYANMKAVKGKKAELEKLKSTFVRRASDFLGNYFASLVDFMISDKSYFSQRGQLKRPDHADLRYKCRTYARLLQHLKGLDKNCLGPLRKAYCRSLNLLLRREAREFANELRAGTKASRNPTVWLEAATASGQTTSNADTSAVSEAYSKMLTIFIPLLVDESSFFAHFMCFEVPTLNPLGSIPIGNRSAPHDDAENDDDLGIMDVDDNDHKAGQSSAELAALNECLRELLDGIQEDFYAVVDWAYKIDPLRCISLNGITERYLSNQKADAAGFVRLLLGDLETRISMQFNRFVDEACHQIERNERNVRQIGVLSYIPRFATLATRMEQYIQGQSRDLVDQAYTKFVNIMFATLEKIAAADQKYADIFLLENYAAFQNSLYDLANVVPTLAKFYHQASEAYEQACTRHINSIIETQFGRLIQFIIQVERYMIAIPLEDISLQNGLSKLELRKVVRATLAGVDKSIASLYKKLQKNLTSEELLPSLWDKCKKEFLEKYENFAQIVAKVYPTETIMSAAEMKELLASMQTENFPLQLQKLRLNSLRSDHGDEPKSKYPEYKHNGAVYATMINILGSSGHISQMEQVINQLKHDSCECKDTLFVSVIKTHSNSGLLEDAVALFKTLPQFNCVNWTESFNTLLQIMVKDSKLEDFHGLFVEYLSGWEVKSRIRAFNLLMDALCGIRRSDLALQVFQEMDLQCCYPDRETYRVLMRGLCGDGRINEATHLLYSMFWRISQKGYGGDVAIYRLLLDCLCDNGLVDEAVGILEKILRKGLRAPKSRRNLNYLDQIRHCEDAGHAKVLINEALIRAGIPSLASYSAMARDLYSEGKVEDANRVLDEMRVRGFRALPAIYEAKVAALCRENKVDEASSVIVDEMVRWDCVPTAKMYDTVVKGFCDVGKSDLAVGLVEKMAAKRCGCSPPTKVTYSAVVDGLCREGRFLEASKMLERMSSSSSYWPRPDTYNALICGLCSMSRHYQAVMWLEEMVSQGKPPKTCTWHVLVASVCANKPELDACSETLHMLSSS